MALEPREDQVRRAYVVGGVVGVIQLAAQFGLNYQRAREFGRDVVRVARGIDQAGRDIAQVIRDNFRSGQTVSRFATNLGPVTTTDPSAPLKRKVDQSFTASVQPKRLFSMKRRGVPNVVPGGIGHYQGDFRKQKLDVSESSLNSYGFIGEKEMYGQINSPDVQYFGVQNATFRMVLRPFVSALVRMMWWRHFKQTYAVDGDLMYEMSVPLEAGHVTVLRLHWRNKPVGTPVSSGYFDIPFINSTTFGQLVASIRTLFQTNNSFGFITGGSSWFCGYSFGYGSLTMPNGVVRTQFSPVYYVDQQKLRLNVLTVIQLQNVTRSSYSTGVGVRDEIGANPLVGKCFTMKGLWPKVEDTFSNAGDWGVTGLQESGSTDVRLGVILPDSAPVGHWRAIPNPQVFSNIMKCDTGLRLEPGEIKKDVLRFSFYGTVEDFRKGFRVPNAASVLENSHDNAKLFGVVKLYAFEKVVPTGPDSVEMNYHLDRYVTCLFDMGYHQNSVATEYAKFTFDRQLVVPVVAP